MYGVKCERFVLPGVDKSHLENGIIKKAKTYGEAEKYLESRFDLIFVGDKWIPQEFSSIGEYKRPEYRIVNL